jgi:branched-chain amino acid aminotransferase
MPSGTTRVRVYALSPDGFRLTPLTGPSLDAVSLQLPEGVYTTLRTYDGDRILGLSAHLRRLAESLRLLGRAVPGEAAGPAHWRSALRQALAQAGLPEARVRLTVPFAGDKVLISVEPFLPYPPSYYESGVVCATRRIERETPRAKHTRAIGRGQAARAQVAPQVHEVLRVDADGRLLEGLSSNFFSVCGGSLYTACDGVLLGVTRGLVLELAAPIGLPLVEQPVRLDELPQLSEAFITSASREVMPVVQIDAAVIGMGRPGPVSQQLLALYRTRVPEDAERP